MAQKLVLVDDIDGSMQDVSTVHFSIEGRGYVIDLTESNLTRLRAAVEEFVSHARRDETPKAAPSRPPGGASPRADKGLSRAVRNWAKTEGIPLKPKGRVPDEMIKQYRQASGF